MLVPPRYHASIFVPSFHSHFGNSPLNDNIIIQIPKKALLTKLKKKKKYYDRITKKKKHLFTRAYKKLYTTAIMRAIKLEKAQKQNKTEQKINRLLQWILVSSQSRPGTWRSVHNDCSHYQVKPCQPPQIMC